MLRLIPFLALLHASGCCFLYPGEGECDPATFQGECRERLAVNCEDVTPVGYGMGVIPRYAAMPRPCGSNVCIETSWGDAACVAEPAQICDKLNATRCVGGFEQRCDVVNALRPQTTNSDPYWVSTRKRCSELAGPKSEASIVPRPLELPKPVIGNLNGDELSDRIRPLSSQEPSTTGVQWTIDMSHGYESEYSIEVRGELWATEVEIIPSTDGSMAELEARSPSFLAGWGEKRILYRFVNERPWRFVPYRVKRQNTALSTWLEWDVDCDGGSCKEVCASHEFVCAGDRSCSNGTCDGSDW